MDGWKVDEGSGYSWHQTEVVRTALISSCPALEFVLSNVISSGKGCARHYRRFPIKSFCLNLTFLPVAPLSPVVPPRQGRDKARITDEVGMGSAEQSL